MESSRSPERWAVRGRRLGRTHPPTCKERQRPRGRYRPTNQQPRPPRGPERPGSLGFCPARHTRSTRRTAGGRPRVTPGPETPPRLHARTRHNRAPPFRRTERLRTPEHQPPPRPFLRRVACGDAAARGWRRDGRAGLRVLPWPCRPWPGRGHSRPGRQGASPRRPGTSRDGGMIGPQGLEARTHLARLPGPRAQSEATDWLLTSLDAVEPSSGQRLRYVPASPPCPRSSCSARNGVIRGVSISRGDMREAPGSAGRPGGGGQTGADADPVGRGVACRGGPGRGG